MEQAGKILALTATVILLMSLLWNLNPRIPRFPWDIRIDKFGFTIYIPLFSALVISVILTIVFNFFVE